MRHCSLLELPENDASGKVLGHHVVLVVDLHKVVDDTLVVWHVSVAQLMYLMEDVMHFFHILGWSDPEFAFGIAKALCLDVLHLHDGEVTLLTPLQLFIQEVEHREVQTPHVVSAG